MLQNDYAFVSMKNVHANNKTVYRGDFCAKHSNSFVASCCVCWMSSAFRLSADFVLNDEVIGQSVRRRVCRAAGQQRRNR